MTTQLLLLPREHTRTFAKQPQTILRKLEQCESRMTLERAKAKALGYIAKHGPSSGEDIVDALKAQGIRPVDVVLAIMDATGSHTKIALRFNISTGYVSKIKSGKCWTHLTRQAV